MNQRWMKSVLATIVLFSINAPTTAQALVTTVPELEAPEHDAGPIETVRPGKPWTDDCGNTIVVTTGAVSVKTTKAKCGPNRGRKCLASVTANGKDEVTIDLDGGTDVEVEVKGEAKVTINGDDQGTMNEELKPCGDPRDQNDISNKNDAGITLGSDGNKGRVTLNGDRNVIQFTKGAKNHTLVISGDNNLVILPGGAGNSVTASGSENVVTSSP